jgi:hypothetical protein
MFGLFKKTEETEEQKKKAEEQKLASLEQKIRSLNHSHSMYRNKLLYVPGGRYSDDHLVMFIGFYHKDGKLRAAFADAHTPSDSYKYWTWDELVFMSGEDAIEEWHNRYLKLKNQFNLLGVELTKIEKS